MPTQNSNRSRKGLPEATASDVARYCIPIPTDPQYRASFFGALLRLGNANTWDIDATGKRYAVAEWWANYALTLQSEMTLCDEHEECREYFPPASIIEYFPCSPFIEGCELPAGYNNAPFTVVKSGDLSEIIGTWGLGYQIGDVYTDLLHLPDGDWSTILDGWRFFPRISITTPEGSGTVKIQFLNIPQGGRALVVLDDDFDLFNLRLIELNKDLVSIPPETTVPFVYELEVTGEGEHLVEIAFLPTVDDTPIPIFFGGGVRSIELCGFGMEGCPDMAGEGCCDETNELLTKILAQLRAGWTLSANTAELGDFQVDCTPMNFDEDEGDDEPTIADRKLALCATVARYIAATLYVEAVTQNAGSTLKTTIKGLIEPLEIPDEFIRGLVLGVPDVIPDLATLKQFVEDDPLYWEAIVCNMVSGLVGKENTFANFREAVTFVGDEPAEEPSFIRLHKIQALLMKTNQIRSNYVMFAKALDAALAEVQDEEFAYACPCDFSEPDGCGIPLELVFDSENPAYAGLVITPMGDNIYRFQNSTVNTDSFYWAQIHDANNQCLHIENPPEGSGYTAEGVATHTSVDCADVVDSDVVGGFAAIEAKHIEWKQGEAMDTYYKITCFES